MDHQVRRRLIKLSQIYGATMPLQYLSDELGLGYDMSVKEERRELIRKVNEISRYEHESGRPLLGALVKGKSKVKKEINKTFYELCEELGIGEAEDLKDKKFKKKHVKKCHQFWSDPKNYDEYYNVLDELMG